MFECFNNILVSCPNGGGLFLVNDRNVHRLDSLDSTGLALRERTLVRGIQPALVVVYQTASFDVNPTSIAFGDIHDVLIDGDSLYLVSTSSNEIVQFNFGGVELERWKFSDEEDSWHINSIEKWNGRVVFSAFGEFREHRGYKGTSAGSGFVQDLHSGERLIEGLSQPHSLTACGEDLLLANSENMELMRFDRNGQLLKSKILDGYVRGVHLDAGYIFVGLSRSRNLSDGTVQTATIVALDAETWDVRDTLSLPVNEIYDLLSVGPQDLPNVVASVAAHTSKLLSRIVSEQNRRVTELGRELDEVRLDGVARMDLMEHASKVGHVLNEGTERLGEARRELTEKVNDALRGVEAEVARLQDVSSSVQRDMRAHEHILETLKAAAAGIRSEHQGLSAELTSLGDLARRGDTLLTEFVGRGERLEQMSGRVEERMAEMFEMVVDRSVQEVALSELARSLESERTRASEVESRLLAQDAAMQDMRERSEADIRVLGELRAELGDAHEALTLKAADLDALGAALSDCKAQLDKRDAEVSDLRAELAAVLQSTSMRVTRPLRAASKVARKALAGLGSLLKVCVFFVKDPIKFVHYGKAAWRLRGHQPHRLALDFISRGGPKPVQDWERAPQPVMFDLRKSGRPAVILTTRHCAYIGREIKQALMRVGIDSEIIFERPSSGFLDVPHFVICPQMFPELPGFYVAFQLEQSVSSRWFTEDYLRRLENSFAIFDYSKVNIAYLKGRGLSLKQIYYLPIGPLGDERPATLEAEGSDPGYDVVFYGDANNDRRQRYLQELQKVCRVRIVSEVFGEELYRILAAAKLVINIHYYPGALLETTRIWESLSLGKLIVSERSSDMHEHQDLVGVVDFVDVDDVDGMVSRVDYWLSHEEERRARVRRNASSLAVLPNRFDYFFYRFLLATDNISFDEFWREAGSRYVLSGDRLCLNLPEYTDRTEGFAEDNKFGFSLFPGLRHSQGWLGCALSYKYMIMLARQHGLKAVTICEDDVEFPDDFQAHLEGIRTHLDESKGGWDIFSGLMADLSKNARILSVDRKGEDTFVVTDKLISTVLNIYNDSVFDAITAWDERNRDVHTNTIDRYLEKRKALRIVTTSPFLVGHKEEQHSTIWGFQNTQYADLIAASTKLLREKIDEFESKRRWW
ncbi:DUF4915 domain-containing protein [Pseudoxanthomonas sp.]|uniref:DUF4915 domain-containing protein n=1 Tax=Pseudoxanthomonas sp. TaxID=1871049 RepID=UPI0028C43217|nr:DUF4915 domain-containing protein [Pseudoxanthomonas sp.]